MMLFLPLAENTILREGEMYVCNDIFFTKVFSPKFFLQSFFSEVFFSEKIFLPQIFSEKFFHHHEKKTDSTKHRICLTNPFWLYYVSRVIVHYSHDSMFFVELRFIRKKNSDHTCF